MNSYQTISFIRSIPGTVFRMKHHQILHTTQPKSTANAVNLHRYLFFDIFALLFTCSFSSALTNLLIYCVCFE